MPIFEYGCARCGATSEYLIRSGDELPRACPTCGAEALERVLSLCSVRTPRVDFSALHAGSREMLERPERFGEAMRAVEARTGVQLDGQRVEAAMDRLSKAGAE